MANTDNPNGFIVVSGGDKSGHIYHRIAGGGAIAVGDAVILDASNDIMTSDGHRYATIATSSSGQLLGVALSAAVADAVNDVAFYVCDDKNAEFEGQCSGDPTGGSAKMVACDIEGATGVMEVNEDAESEKVISITGLVDIPTNTAGTNARVTFKIIRHQMGSAPIDA